MNNDHRSLGRELHLFDTAPMIGAGLPLWLPAGAVIRSELERFADEHAQRSGCQRVYTPVLAKRELFERSGHWDKFAEDMFPPMRVGSDELVLRPANCPSHVQVFAAEPHSWRQLPVRLSESASMFRSELSGVLGGLSRVRQISLDDAHVFCREDQVASEVALALGTISQVYETLGIEVDHYRLSVRGAGKEYAGEDGAWMQAESELRGGLAMAELPYRRTEGEAAFYGPKIDVQVLDAAGREETLSTVQVDRVLPERFDLGYTGADGARHRPVMIHRGVMGSMERLVALLIERDEGRFPTWLSPVQVAVIPLDPRRHGDHAQDVVRRLQDAGIRVVLSATGSLGARIRDARKQRNAYIAVLGDREVSDDTVSVGDERLPFAVFLEELLGEIAERSLNRRL